MAAGLIVPAFLGGFYYYYCTIISVLQLFWRAVLEDGDVFYVCRRDSFER